jgi:hypothetical protein
VFTRRRKPIALIGREGGFFKIMPKTAKLVPITAAQLPKFGPYRSERAYARAVREAEGLLPDEIELVADAAE